MSLSGRLNLIFKSAWRTLNPNKFDHLSSISPLIRTKESRINKRLLENEIENREEKNFRKQTTLKCAFANEFPEIYEPPRELIEGFLSLGGGSVMYGDSNTGKTFLAIDMAAAISRGAPWMGMRTQIGMVLYLAAESPASVRARLHAYQKHHGLKIANFALVESPINIFDGECDTDLIVQLIREIEVRRRLKVVLVVGDTLSRLTAGANENAGQDMGLVIRRIDRVRSECNVHFCLIHHAGKVAAAGARGWSGVRAAVDTEIEIKTEGGGSVARVTKQRDLASKGRNFGFRLEAVEIGATAWAPVTSCVVLPEAAVVARAATKRMGAVDTAVLNYLNTPGVGMLKKDVVAGLAASYDRGSVYRSIQSLLQAAVVVQSDNASLHVS